MHPAGGVDCLARSLLIVPVTEHDRIAAGHQLAGHPTRHDAACGIDDFDLDMRLDPAYGPNPALHWVVGRALKADRAGFGHPVGDRDLADVHQLDRPLHDFDRTRTAGHDAGAQ